MPATATPFQHEINSILKQVDDSVKHFCGSCQRASDYSQSQEIDGCEDLKTLSTTLQQHHSQLQSLSSKSGIRKVQRKEIDAALVSLDDALERYHTLQHDLLKRKENGNNKQTASPPRKDSLREEAEDGADSATRQSEVTVADEDVKVQWEQLHRVDGDDSEMLEEFICKICQVHVVGCSPKLTRCSHLFCGDCIAKWFEIQPKSLSWAQRAQSAGSVPCPVCKEPLQQDRDLYTVCSASQNENALLWRLLSGVKIVCANNKRCRHDGKCTWIGEYGSYQQHIKTCKNLPPVNESPVAELAVPSPEFESLQCMAPSRVPCQTIKDNKETAAKIPKTHPKVNDGAAHSSGTQPRTAGASDSSSLTGLIQQLVSLESNHSQIEVDSSPKRSSANVKNNNAGPSDAVSASRAVRRFSADGPSQLCIEEGDLIEVVNRHSSGWTYGRKVSQAGAARVNCDEDESIGWFPNWVIA